MQFTLQVKRDLDIQMASFLSQESDGKEKVSLFQLTFKEVRREPRRAERCISLDVKQKGSSVCFYAALWRALCPGTTPVLPVLSASAP